MWDRDPGEREGAPSRAGRDILVWGAERPQFRGIRADTRSRFSEPRGAGFSGDRKGSRLLETEIYEKVEPGKKGESVTPGDARSRWERADRRRLHVRHGEMT